MMAMDEAKDEAKDISKTSWPFLGPTHSPIQWETETFQGE
jgi:hypothetical protein